MQYHAKTIKDADLSWMCRLEDLLALDSQLAAAERRWRQITREPDCAWNPVKRQIMAEARQDYQEAGLAYYLAATGTGRNPLG